MLIHDCEPSVFNAMEGGGMARSSMHRYYTMFESLFSMKSYLLGYQCNERPRKLGCFQDSPTDKLMTYKFGVHMKKSDWSGEKWNVHLDKLLCKYD